MLLNPWINLVKAWLNQFAEKKYVIGLRKREIDYKEYYVHKSLDAELQELQADAEMQNCKLISFPNYPLNLELLTTQS